MCLQRPQNSQLGKDPLVLASDVVVGMTSYAE